MSDLKVMMAVLIVSLALIPAAGFAAEHGGQEHGGAAQAPSAPTPSAPTPSAPTQEDGGQATAPTPAPAVSALKPITITFSGEVTSWTPPVEATATTPAQDGALETQDRYGVKKVKAVPPGTKVLPEGRTLADLKTGDKVTVDYTYDVASGKRTTQSITLGEITPPAGT